MIALRLVRSACAHACAAPGLVILLYLAGLLLAFPAFYVFQSVLASALGNSLAGQSLLSGFDFTIWVDLLNAHGLSLATLLPFAISIGVLGIIVQTFLAGGVLDLFVREKRFSPATFFRGCGTYAGRFLRIWLLTALILALIGLLFITLLGVVTAMTGTQPDSDRAGGIAIIVLLACLSFLLLLVFMASDYARVTTVVGGIRSSWKAVGRGFLFVFRNAGSALGFHLLLLLLLGAVLAVYLVLEGGIEPDSPSTVLPVIVLQQLFMIVRVAIRVAFSAGEVALYEERKPPPVVFYGWDDSPPVPGH